MTSFFKLFLVATLGVSSLAATAAPNGEVDVFRDPNGDDVRVKDIITCTFSPVTPDGQVVLFFPTSNGNLSAIPKNRSTNGKSINYTRSGTTDHGFYRAYQSGSVMVFTHRDKPLVVMQFNGAQFNGDCDKIIPQYMSQ